MNFNLHLLKKILFILLLSLSFSLFATSQAQAVTFTRKSFLQNLTSTSVDIRWVTDTNTQLIVKYGTTASYGSQVLSDTVSGTGGAHNHARISGLTPNTRYYYQITTNTGTAMTPAGDANHSFTTPPSSGSATPFSFAFWGDSGNGSARQNNVARQVFNKRPNLAFIAGDIIYDYGTNFTFNNSKYFNIYSDASPGQNSMSFAPYYVACGNHEDSCPTVVADHSLPGGGAMGGPLTTYSFDYGNVHFVSLNSNGSFAYNATNPSASDPQIRWAYNDLRASNQPWKVVYFHHNGWSAGSHSSNTAVNNNLVKMANDAGADIVFWGHSHVYERWNRRADFFPNLQQFTIGNGGVAAAAGSACTSTSPGPGCAFKSSGEAGFLLAEVNGNNMTIRYITESGTNPDSVTLNSGGGGGITNPPTATPTRVTTVTPQPTITGTIKPGDVNRDNLVNILDFQLLSNSFGKSSGQAGYNANADFNGDSRIDILDFQVLSNNFGR